MAMESKTYEAKKGFNTIFNLVENCKILVPEYNRGKIKDDKFFFGMRDGVESLQDVGSILKEFGEYSDAQTTKKLVLAEDGLYEFDDETPASLIEAFSDDARMFEMVALGGTEQDSGSATGGANPVPPADAFLEDTSQAWGVDIYAGSYIWITDGTAAGEIQPIKGNTADKIEVEGWTNAVAPDNTSTYKIYTEVVETVIVSSATDNVVKVYDGTAMDTVTTLTPLFAASSFDGRFWYATEVNKNIIFYSEVGQNFQQDGFIVSGSQPIINMRRFGDYLVLGRSNDLIAIRKSILADGVVIYLIADLVAELGMKAERSVGIWRGGYYFISNDNQIYTLSINVTGEDQIFGTVENISSQLLGGYIAAFESAPTDAYVKPTSTGISIFYTVADETLEFKFEDDYKGWLVNIYKAVINDFQFVVDKDYLAVSTSIARLGTKQDLGVDYTQKVGYLYGTDEIFSMKQIYGVQAVFEFEDNIPDGTVDVDVFGTYIQGGFTHNIESTVPDSAASLGENVLGTAILGGVTSTLLGNLQILRKIVHRNGQYFQITYSNAEDGFNIGDCLITYAGHTPRVHGRATTT